MIKHINFIYTLPGKTTPQLIVVRAGSLSVLRLHFCGHIDHKEKPSIYLCVCVIIMAMSVARSVKIRIDR